MPLYTKRISPTKTLQFLYVFVFSISPTFSPFSCLDQQVPVYMLGGFPDVMFYHLSFTAFQPLGASFFYSVLTMSSPLPKNHKRKIPPKATQITEAGRRDAEGRAFLMSLIFFLTKNDFLGFPPEINVLQQLYWLWWLHRKKLSKSSLDIVSWNFTCNVHFQCNKNVPQFVHFFI